MYLPYKTCLHFLQQIAQMCLKEYDQDIFWGRMYIARNLIVALVVSYVLQRLVVLARMRWSLVYKRKTIKSVRTPNARSKKMWQGREGVFRKITLRKCESARRKNDNCSCCAPKHMASCNQLKVRLPWYSLCTKPDDIKSLLSSFQFESLDFFPFWMLYSIWTYRV